MAKFDDMFLGALHTDDAICGFCGPFRWLSNFYPCSVTHDGYAYRSSEAAYQAAKFPSTERWTFTQLSANESKKTARARIDKIATNEHYKFASEWTNRKEQVMLEILRSKFVQNPELKRLLITTGSKHLEETNTWGDTFWGVCRGVGNNRLGELLMVVRGELNVSLL